MRARHTLALAGGLLLALTACGSDFSDDAVEDGEKQLTNSTYAVVVPEDAEEVANTDRRIAVRWPAAGGEVSATVEQENAQVLGEAGQLTRSRATVAGADVERVDADLRALTANEPGERIRYRVGIASIPKPSAERPTTIELQLTAPESVTDQEVQEFRDAAQAYLDQVQID